MASATRALLSLMVDTYAKYGPDSIGAWKISRPMRRAVRKLESGIRCQSLSTTIPEQTVHQGNRPSFAAGDENAPSLANYGCITHLGSDHAVRVEGLVHSDTDP